MVVSGAAADLKSAAFGRGGSSPPSGTRPALELGPSTDARRPGGEVAALEAIAEDRYRLADGNEAPAARLDLEVHPALIFAAIADSRYGADRPLFPDHDAADFDPLQLQTLVDEAVPRNPDDRARAGRRFELQDPGRAALSDRHCDLPADTRHRRFDRRQGPFSRQHVVGLPRRGPGRHAGGVLREQGQRAAGPGVVVGAGAFERPGFPQGGERAVDHRRIARVHAVEGGFGVVDQEQCFENVLFHIWAGPEVCGEDLAKRRILLRGRQPGHHRQGVTAIVELSGVLGGAIPVAGPKDAPEIDGEVRQALFQIAAPASLRQLDRPPAEVVIVDSGSVDGSAELVRSAYPEFELIDCGENVGFCRGNNLGIQATQSPYVLALNPDTVLQPDFLERLLPAFDDPQVGLVAGKLLRFDQATLDSAGQLLTRSRRPRDRGYGRRDQGQFDRDEEVFGVCGAAALYRREMLDSVADPGPSYFDEVFFAFGEDLDLAWRARRAGWRSVYRHRAVGLHARGGSATGSTWLRRRAALLGRSPEIRFHVLKNRYLTILRNDTVAGYLANLPFVLARDLSVLALVLLASPGVVARLWRERAVFSGALERRRLDAARGGHHVGGDEND